METFIEVPTPGSDTDSAVFSEIIPGPMYQDWNDSKISLVPTFQYGCPNDFRHYGEEDERERSEEPCTVCRIEVWREEGHREGKGSRDGAGRMGGKKGIRREVEGEQLAWYI